ncbi:MAG: glycoside hydrolase family 3 C-terminal domain-containing protein [Lachnospiraceae bacterium]|nr:glycoside hydrolase family 3 C-terminal domain-containing protein [Lachnospiraceae bacterium]
MEEERTVNPLWDENVSTGEKLQWLIKELTIDEKLHMLGSGSKGVERLGIPDLQLGGEAAHGVVARNWKDGEILKDTTTSFPQPIGMSSSWDRTAIKEAGRIVGKEARIVYSKRGWGGLSRWAPTVDLLRDPRWGRNEEAYGEDPVQVGGMASAYIQGMQGDDKDHLIAASTLKHFYANNTEIGRGWKNSSISPRNKYELYIEPFRRCIEEGGAEGVMTAYNRINGVLGMFNPEVTTLLKDEFGLTHVVSDGGAMELSAGYCKATALDAETVANSVKAGVDGLSSWGDGIYKAACEAYELGLLTEDDIDGAIRNSYRTKIKLGIFDKSRNSEDYGELCDEDASAVCKDLSDRSLVLLKNDGVLPLEGETAENCILIGPLGDKWYQDWYGGETPEQISLLEGIKNCRTAAGFDDDLTYVDACDRIRIKCGDKYLASDSEGRVTLSYEGEVFVFEDWGEDSYTFRNEATGKYLTTHLAGDAIEGIATAEGVSAGTIAGKVYEDADRVFSWFDLEVFRMDVHDGADESILRDRFGNRLFADKDGYIVTAAEDYPGLTPLSFVTEKVRNGIEEAISAATKAKTVIMALGHNPMINAKEEIDRGTIEFIPYQQKLFDEVCKINPNIVVVLMSNYPFAIDEINDKAKAILWSATGSQCMGRSIADVLTGKVCPAGRLTQTWLKSDEDLPSIDDYDIIGKGRTYRYFEGEVLYPFGYGLTYSSFAYSDLRISISQAEGKADEKAGKSRRRKAFGQPEGVYDSVRGDNRLFVIEVTVTNTGDRESDEVVQIYASAKNSRVKRAGKQLIGFERVRNIVPGESRIVNFVIPVRELAYYDVVSESLIIEDGDYLITAASSSLDRGMEEIVHVSGSQRGTRDMSGKIKADHYDEECGTQIVEGLYGYSAIMAECSGVYEPDPDGHFSATYEDCLFPEDGTILRIHGYAREEARVRICVDGIAAGEASFNTRDYEKRPSDARNHMPRAVVSETARKESFTALWADIHIPLDMSKLSGADPSGVHVIRIEADGPFKYDWFSVIPEPKKFF